MDEQIKLFYSYAHEDEGLRRQLEKHLAMLRRLGTISEWHDRAISAGSGWEKEIRSHLESADLVLLLVSPDFLASQYCFDVEMRRALERHDSGTCRVIPVVLRPVEWRETPFARLQALPRDAKPITTWRNRDEAFQDVVRGISSVVDELRMGLP